MSWIDNRWKKLWWDKDQERYIPRKCTITITVCNCDDCTQPHTLEMHWQIQTYRIARKDQSPYVYGRYQHYLPKTEKKLETLIQAMRIYTRNIFMEFSIEKCVMLTMKSRKWHMMEGIELPTPGKIQTLGEKEKYKYLRISETEIKQKN